MANEDTVQTPKFTIRRLRPGEDEPSPSPVSVPQEPAPSKATPPTKAPARDRADGSRRRKKRPEPKPVASMPDQDCTAGLFASARSALAFVGAAFNVSQQTGEAMVRRSPADAWWVEINAPTERVAQLVFATGGTPYAPQGRRWVPLTPAGTMPETPRDAVDASGWPVLDLASLLAVTALLATRYCGAAILEVLIPGPAARWALRRAAALGIEASIAQADLRPLGHENAPPAGRLHIQLRAPHGRMVPAAFVHSLGALPYVAVCDPGDEVEGTGRLLVDVRCQLPLPAPLLQAMVPAEEIWVLAPADVGHCRLTLNGPAIPAAGLFDADETSPVHPACAVPAARFPDPIPVRIVPKRGPRRRVDAVLVDDAELDWLRRFLIGRPVSELAFILPGNERHLVTAPGGLPEALPFGAPLAWIGPGAIYIELGSDFDPPLPAAARQARFLPDRDAVVGVLRSGTWRFDPENMVPVWTLWVGDAPTVQTGMAIRGRAILAQADYYLSAREMPQPGQGSGHLAPISDQERTGLIEAAQRAELNGGFVRAAELLEQAGLHGPAGRLYERAAGAQGVQQH